MASVSSWVQSSARKKNFSHELVLLSVQPKWRDAGPGIRRPSDLANWRRTCAPGLIGEQCLVVGPE